MVDSSVFIDVERRRQDIDVLTSAEPGEELVLATITVSELLTGAYLANTEERRLLRMDFVEGILQSMRVLPLDVSVARNLAELRARLRVAGSLIGDHDMIIAATASTHGYSVLTHNVRDFGRVPDLVVKRPAW